jgi:hypothetical protein
MFEHICQQNIFLVMSLSHLPNFSQNQFEDNEGCVDVLYMDSRTSRVLQLFDLHARHSEKFPSRFGGHLLSMNIPLEKSGGILHLVGGMLHLIAGPLSTLGLYPTTFAYTDRYDMSCKVLDSSSTC